MPRAQRKRSLARRAKFLFCYSSLALSLSLSLSSIHIRRLVAVADIVVVVVVVGSYRFAFERKTIKSHRCESHVVPFWQCGIFPFKMLAGLQSAESGPK